MGISDTSGAVGCSSQTNKYALGSAVQRHVHQLLPPRGWNGVRNALRPRRRRGWSGSRSVLRAAPHLAGATARSPPTGGRDHPVPLSTRRCRQTYRRAGTELPVRPPRGPASVAPRRGPEPSTKSGSCVSVVRRMARGHPDGRIGAIKLPCRPKTGAAAWTLPSEFIGTGATGQGSTSQDSWRGDRRPGRRLLRNGWIVRLCERAL